MDSSTYHLISDILKDMRKLSDMVEYLHNEQITIKRDYIAQKQNEILDIARRPVPPPGPRPESVPHRPTRVLPSIEQRPISVPSNPRPRSPAPHSRRYKLPAVNKSERPIMCF